MRRDSGCLINVPKMPKPSAMENDGQGKSARVEASPSSGRIGNAVGNRRKDRSEEKACSADENGEHVTQSRRRNFRTLERSSVANASSTASATSPVSLGTVGILGSGAFEWARLLCS